MKNQPYSIFEIFTALFFITVPLLFGLYSITLGQDINWDLLNYHLYSPYAYLNGRMHLDLSPAGQQSYFNPLLDLVYFVANSALSPKFVGFLIGLIQGISYVFIYNIANQVLGKGRNWDALFLGLAGLLSVGFLSEVGTTFHDSLIGVLTLASLWLSISAIERIERDQPSFKALISISGILMGVACGLKLVFVIYALALFVGLLLVPFPWSVRFKLALPFGVFAFAGLLLTGGFWFYKVWGEFGNPLFPQFNDIFHGALVSSEPIRDIRFLPKTFYDKLFYPAIFTIDPIRVGELQFRQVSWIFGYVALIALGFACLFRSNRSESYPKLSAPVILLVCYFGIAYFLWLNIFGVYRYIIPIEVLIPVLIFIAIDYFFKPGMPRWVPIVFLSFITLANLKGAPDWGRSNWADKLYRVESSVLTNSPNPAVLYLVGQPLAWIIPALQIKTPFVQLAPNMPVTEVYWKKAKELARGRSGKQYAIFESSSSDLASRAIIGLKKLGLAVDENTCDHLITYLGSTRYEYRYCEVKAQF